MRVLTHCLSFGKPRSLIGLWLGLTGLLAAIALSSLLYGAGDIGPARAWQALQHMGTASGGEARFVLTELRMPRLWIGLVVGAALGIAGALLQAVTRNPLAEPGLLGVSAGAAFAVTLAILWGADTATLRVSVAQLGALGGCLCVLAAARLQGIGDDPIRLILAGAILSGLLHSLSSLILLYDQYTADEIRFWVVGSLAGRQLDDLVPLFPSLGIAALLTVMLARPLAALALGEHVAIGLGHHPRLVRLLVIVVVALLVGGATAAAGPIAFVGLVVPHIARYLGGVDYRWVVPYAGLIGGLLVVTADIIGRVVVRPGELQVGIMMALVGGPVFIVLVRRLRLVRL